MEQFGPSYRTTAEDRRNRISARNNHMHDVMAGQDGQGRSRLSVAEASNLLSHPHPTTQSAGRALASSSHIPLLPNELGPGLAHHSDSLLDISNERLEQLVTLDDCMATNVRGMNINSFLRVSPGVNDLDHTSYANVQGMTEVGGGHHLSGDPHFTRYRTVPRVLNEPRVVDKIPSQLGKTDRTVVMELINKLEVVDGSEEIKLVDFLRNILPIISVSPEHNQEVIKLMIPKVRGRLFNLWMDGVVKRVCWDELHTGILDTFIPAMRRREIEAMELDRPQQAQESFAEYCENLIAAGFALKSRLGEQDVIDIIMNKCHPMNKTHFTFGDYPKTLGELRSLVTRVTSAIRAERRYFGQDANQERNLGGHRSGSSGTRPTLPGHPNVHRLSTGRSSSRVLRCFRCHQEGHMARNCSANLNSK